MRYAKQVSIIILCMATPFILSEQTTNSIQSRKSSINIAYLPKTNLNMQNIAKKSAKVNQSLLSLNGPFKRRNLTVQEVGYSLIPTALTTHSIDDVRSKTNKDVQAGLESLPSKNVEFRDLQMRDQYKTNEKPLVLGVWELPPEVLIINGQSPRPASIVESRSFATNPEISTILMNLVLPKTKTRVGISDSSVVNNKHRRQYQSGEGYSSNEDSGETPSSNIYTETTDDYGRFLEDDYRTQIEKEAEAWLKKQKVQNSTKTETLNAVTETEKSYSKETEHPESKETEHPESMETEKDHRQHNIDYFREYNQDMDSQKGHSQDMDSHRGYNQDMYSQGGHNQDMDSQREYNQGTDSDREYNQNPDSQREYNPDIDSHREYNQNPDSQREYNPDIDSQREYNQNPDSQREYNPDIDSQSEYNQESDFQLGYSQNGNRAFFYKGNDVMFENWDAFPILKPFFYTGPPENLHLSRDVMQRLLHDSQKPFVYIGSYELPSQYHTDPDVPTRSQKALPIINDHEGRIRQHDSILNPPGLTPQSHLVDSTCSHEEDVDETPKLQQGQGKWESISNLKAELDEPKDNRYQPHFLKPDDENSQNYVPNYRLNESHEKLPPVYNPSIVNDKPHYDNKENRQVHYETNGNYNEHSPEHKTNIVTDDPQYDSRENTNAQHQTNENNEEHFSSYGPDREHNGPHYGDRKKSQIHQYEMKNQYRVALYEHDESSSRKRSPKTPYHFHSEPNAKSEPVRHVPTTETSTSIPHKPNQNSIFFHDENHQSAPPFDNNKHFLIPHTHEQDFVHLQNQNQNLIPLNQNKHIIPAHVYNRDQNFILPRDQKRDVKFHSTTTRPRMIPECHDLEEASNYQSDSKLNSILSSSQEKKLWDPSSFVSQTIPHFTNLVSRDTKESNKHPLSVALIPLASTEQHSKEMYPKEKPTHRRQRSPRKRSKEKKQKRKGGKARKRQPKKQRRSTKEHLKAEAATYHWGMENHKDKDGFFMYANIPYADAFEYGYRMGGPEQTLERHHRTQGRQSKIKLNWEDQNGDSGDQYWEFNHSSSEHEDSPRPSTSKPS